MAKIFPRIFTERHLCRKTYKSCIGKREGTKKVSLSVTDKPTGFKSKRKCI